jgi:predicted Ser/Thr protein kinase
MNTFDRLDRIFMNRTIRMYPAFSEFYGMEETIERIVGFLRHAAQGLEERKQIMYLLGPVGGGKSSLAERLKALMEVHPIYVLKAGEDLSPVFESPLGLFDPDRMGGMLEERYGIPEAPAERPHEPVVPEAARRVQRRHFQIPGAEDAAVAAAPDRHRQDRAGR